MIGAVADVISYSCALLRHLCCYAHVRQTNHVAMTLEHGIGEFLGELLLLFAVGYLVRILAFVRVGETRNTTIALWFLVTPLNYCSLLLLVVPVELASLELGFVCRAEQASQLLMIIVDMLMQAHFALSQDQYSEEFTDLRLLGLAAHIGARMKLYKFFAFKRARPSYRYLMATHELCPAAGDQQDVGMLEAAESVGKLSAEV